MTKIRFSAATGGGGGGGSLFPNAPVGGGWVTMWNREQPLLSEIKTEATVTASDPVFMLNNNTWRVQQIDNAYPGYFNQAVRIVHPGGRVEVLDPDYTPGGVAAQALYANSITSPHRLTWPRADAPIGDLFVGMYIRWPNYGGNPYYLANLGGQKILYIESRENYDGLNMPHIIIRKGGTNTSGGRAAFEPQFTDASYNNAYWADDMEPYLGEDPNWHRLEYLIYGNTRYSGAVTNFLSDGRMTIWVDGVQVGNWTNLYFYLGGYHQHVMNSIHQLPVYGGGLLQPPWDIAHDFGRMLVMAR